MTITEDVDVFFWLGAEGEVKSVTEEELNEEQCKCRKRLEDWINARVENWEI
jgi:hypothetical protein